MDYVYYPKSYTDNKLVCDCNRRDEIWSYMYYIDNIWDYEYLTQVSKINVICEDC